MKTADLMAMVDPAMLDAAEGFVVAYMSHRRHETEAQTRAAIAKDPSVAASHMRKVQRACVVLMAAGFDLRAAPATPRKPQKL